MNFEESEKERKKLNQSAHDSMLAMIGIRQAYKTLEVGNKDIDKEYMLEKLFGIVDLFEKKREKYMNDG